MAFFPEFLPLHQSKGQTFLVFGEGWRQGAWEGEGSRGRKENQPPEDAPNPTPRPKIRDSDEIIELSTQ